MIYFVSIMFGILYGFHMASYLEGFILTQCMILLLYGSIGIALGLIIDSICVLFLRNICKIYDHEINRYKLTSVKDVFFDTDEDGDDVIRWKFVHNNKVKQDCASINDCKIEYHNGSNEVVHYQLRFNNKIIRFIFGWAGFKYTLLLNDKVEETSR